MTQLVPQPSSQRHDPQVTEASEPPEYPVREYIGGMAAELARMARWDGDDTLGGLLETVAEMAALGPDGRAR